MSRVLVIDDDEIFRLSLGDILRGEGHTLATAESIEQGLRLAESTPFDLVFLDVRLPDGNGLTLLPGLKALPSRPEVIIITGSSDTEGAQMAIEGGAWDYIVKTASIHHLRLACLRALEYRNKKLTLLPVNASGIVGGGKWLKRCLQRLARAAASDAPVLILGETGTGKELFARAVHANSPRAGGPFVVVDCAALHESLLGSELFGHTRGAFTGALADKDGLVRLANGGALFLDEVSELAPEMQKSFLRVLESNSYRPLGSGKEYTSNFRLVSVSNKDLEELVRQGRFRQDLLYRIQGAVLRLPPLRDRPEDIPELTAHHLAAIRGRQGLEPAYVSQEFMDLLQRYHWPGNVRELVRVLETASAQEPDEPELRSAHLPADLRRRLACASAGDEACAQGSAGFSPPPPEGLGWKTYRDQALNAAEKEYVMHLMAACKNDKRQAQRVSGLSQSRLYGLLKKHGRSRG
ncbi:MAG: sigma-54-dependent transcriptional regulator [Desulfovibrionaceae bacterium]